MRICKNCNTILDADDIFCPGCGLKYEEPEGSFCPRCGFELAEDEQYCMCCGAPVGDQPDAMTPVRSREAAAVYTKMYQADGVRQASFVSSIAGAEAAVMAGTASGTAYYVPERLQEDDADLTDAVSSSSFYIVDFIKSLFSAHRIPVIIYLALNILFIWGFCFLVTEGNIKVSIIAAVVLYLVSVTIALSPIGESLLRIQTRCKPVKDEEVLAKMEPLFNEAWNRAAIQAKREGLSIPSDVRMFMNDAESLNAFATGRKTICFTEGILDRPDDQIIATLCHEFGHIAHHDTDLILLITVGNMIMNAILFGFYIGTTIFKVMMDIIMIFVGGEEGLFGSLIGHLSAFITVALLNLFVRIWTQFGNILVMKTSRGEEFKADEFAFHCGYGNSLCAMLDFLSGGKRVKETGLFATLMSSHPPIGQRIAALQELGAEYQGAF